jgi:hypothetical protein
MRSVYTEEFLALLDEHPELDELSDHVLEELVADDETYAQAVRLGWFEGGDDV